MLFLSHLSAIEVSESLKQVKKKTLLALYYNEKKDS